MKVTPKKIVIDARELRTSSGRYVERLLHYLQQVDKTNNYIILLTRKDMNGWEPTNPRFTKQVTHYKEFTFGEQLGFFWQIRKLKADLVFFPFAQQPVLYRGKVVTTVQDLTGLRFNNPSKNRVMFEIKQFIYGLVIKYAARKSKALIAPTAFVRDDVARYARINSRKFTITHEAAEPMKVKPESVPDLEGKRFIMYVGRPLPHKNLSRLVEAFAVLKQKNPDLRLVLVGKKDALYKALEKDVRNQGIPGVIFTDFISDSKLRWLFQHAQVYAFPSLSEGFGLPGLEAMVEGCPVVSSNATCLPEVYKDAVLYFDPLSTQEITETIQKVLDDPKLQKELRKKGHKLVDNYSWKHMAEQTLEVFTETLG